MKLGIIGVGSFGRAILKLLPPAAEVIAYDIIPENVPSTVKAGSIEEVCGCNVVILAVPLGSYEHILRLISKSLHRTSVLVDVCSVKTTAERFKEQYLPQHTSYLSVHPLFGPRSIETSKQLKKVVVTHCGDERACEVLHRAESSIGIEIVETTPENHDRIMAYTQALTFFLGEALQDFLPDQPVFSPPSYGLLTGLRDFVANTSPQLTATIESNPYFNETIESFMETLSKRKDKTT